MGTPKSILDPYLSIQPGRLYHTRPHALNMRGFLGAGGAIFCLHFSSQRGRPLTAHKSLVVDDAAAGFRAHSLTASCSSHRVRIGRSFFGWSEFESFGGFGIHWKINKRNEIKWNWTNSKTTQRSKICNKTNLSKTKQMFPFCTCLTSSVF